MSAESYDSGINVYKKTVFFLGAGASASFRFPCGNDLIREICNDIRSDTSIRKFLQEELGVEPDQFEYFGNTFVEARNHSIDEFLESRDDLKDLARFFVASKIIERENPYNIHGSLYDWLTVYLRNLLENITSLSSAQEALGCVNFFTLNYDRSVEYIIYTLLKARYMTNDQKSNTLIENILGTAGGKVIHLHGKVGSLSNEEGENCRPYTMEFPKKENFQSIAKYVTFWDDLSGDSNGYSILNSMIENADQIFFLGFGFHKGIICRFNPNIFSNKKIFCTVKGLGQWKWREVVHLLCPEAAVFEIPPYGERVVGKVRFGSKDQTCDDFVQEIFQN